jgi:carbon-monoxide dehydrogenase large subunit
MENRACIAEYDRGRRSLTLTLSTQIPGIIRDVLSDLLDMPGHSVRVIAPDVGGGFGGKASLYQEEILVAVLARHLGRAVRWTGSRAEDLMATSHGFDEVIEAELGLERDGSIRALKAEVDPPPLKWSTLSYVFAHKEDRNAEEELQAGRDCRQAAAG